MSRPPPHRPSAIGRAAVMGEVAELAGCVGTFSARTLQIEQNIDSYEAE